MLTAVAPGEMHSGPLSRSSSSTSFSSFRSPSREHLLRGGSFDGLADAVSALQNGAGAQPPQARRTRTAMCNGYMRMHMQHAHAYGHAYGHVMFMYMPMSMSMSTLHVHVHMHVHGHAHMHAYACACACNGHS